MRRYFITAVFIAMNAGLYAQLTLPGGYTPMSAERRLRAANTAGNYLVVALGEAGTFAYDVNLKTGEATSRYVWEDHALATLSLVRLFEYGGDRSYLAAAEKAAKPLLAKLEKVLVGKDDYTAFVGTAQIDGESRKVVKTTECAFVAAALAELDRVRKTATHQDSVKALCSYLATTVSKTGEVKPVLLLGMAATGNRFLELHSKTVQSKMLFALATVNAAIPQDSLKACLQQLVHPVAYQWQEAVEKPQTKAFDNWGVIGMTRCLDQIDDDVMKKHFDAYKSHVDGAVKRIEAELKTDITRHRRKSLSNLLIRAGALREVVKRGGAMTRDAVWKLAFSYCKAELLSLIRKEGDPNRGTFDTRLRTAGRLLPTASRVEGISAVATIILRDPKSPLKEKIGNWVPDVDLARRYILSRQITPKLAKKYNTELNVTGAFAINSICITPCCHAINAFLGW